MTILADVTERALTLVTAGELMGVCYRRQSKRIWRRYQDQGDTGLMHRLRGQPGPRRKPPELWAQVLAKYEDKDYADFGPTLLAEHLLQERLVVDHETLRRWRMADGKHTVLRRQQKQRRGNGGCICQASRG